MYEKGQALALVIIQLEKTAARCKHSGKEPLPTELYYHDLCFCSTSVLLCFTGEKKFCTFVCQNVKTVFSCLRFHESFCSEKKMVCKKADCLRKALKWSSSLLFLFSIRILHIRFQFYPRQIYVQSGLRFVPCYRGAECRIIPEKK